jgi:phosphate starvation-inducible protein PhoH
MFLTRLGNDSKMIVTGDDSQIDLAPGQTSGLRDAIHRLRDCRGIEILRLSETDIVRHRLVHDIVKRYDDQRAGAAPIGRSSDNHAVVGNDPSNRPDVDAAGL